MFILYWFFYKKIFFFKKFFLCDKRKKNDFYGLFCYVVGKSEVWGYLFVLNWFFLGFILNFDYGVI